MSFEIDISDSTSGQNVDLAKLEAALRHALAVEQVASAVLSISVVTNDEIHRLNRQHLQHDYATDVISFQLDWTSPNHATPPVVTTGRSVDAAIEGEIVVSRHYAEEMAERCGWTLQDELTLYVIHGMLHICGYDDMSPSEKEIMRSRERFILNGLGLSPSYPDDDGGTGTDRGDEPPGTTESRCAISESTSEGCS